MNRDTSIVQSLNSRSINGCKLGLHLHQHKGMEIHMCWNIIPATGCYFENCIARRIKTFREYDEFVASVCPRVGLDGACECFYVANCHAELRERAKPCHYVRGGGPKI